MDQRPSQPPEGKLISDALARTGMSIREASSRAGISYGRWRQITSGYQNVSPGSYAQVRAPAATLARMAAAVGVTAADLTEAGRGDAAELLDSITRENSDNHGHAVTGLTADEARIMRAYLDGLRKATRRRRGNPEPANGGTALGG